MKKYRIKNEAVEKAVRGLFLCEQFFEEALQSYCKHYMGSFDDCVFLRVTDLQSVMGKTCELYIKKDDIELIEEYNPKAWNEYPKVIPPKEGWYRIHYEIEDVGYVRRVIYWNGKEWETNCPFVERFAFGFKPRDDEEGEE